MIDKEYEKLIARIKKDISMFVDEEYEELVDRIKFDLYKEFIDPETATYGIKYVENDHDYDSGEGIISDKDKLKDELSRLCLIQNKFVDDEKYEKAELMKNKIIKLQNKINKL
jgi:hypothetical protein